MGESKIEWTEEVWNPMRGCSEVSPGCANCYAKAFGHRYSRKGLAFHGYVTTGPKGDPLWTGKVDPLIRKLREPLGWREPKLVFVNSMSDLFHEDMPFEEIAAIYGVMAATPQHTYQVLTKRARRMREFHAWAETASSTPAMTCLRAATSKLPRTSMGIELAWPPPNVWLGVSVESQRYADDRIPELLQTPAAVRFVSCEPLLGLTGLWAFLKSDLRDRSLAALGASPMPGLDWVIVGGESGPGAREFHLQWAREIVRECDAADVPVFVKQVGKVAFDGAHGRRRLPLVHPKGGNMEEWPDDLRGRRAWPKAWRRAA